MSRAILVMGVSGVGKTTLGMDLAAALGAAFVEGDDLHSDADRAKMAAGVPLTDEDRWPWLDTIVAEATKPRTGPLVLTCSALKRTYRDRLREGIPGLVILYPAATREAVRARMAQREGHFMPLSLLDSQFDALEEPIAEPQVVTISAEQTPEAMLADAVAGLRDL